MAVRPKTSGPSLFAAAGLDKDAPRPLADKLRPQKLDEVVGQDHLLGPDGALTRMLETRSLGSLVFWGPPGTGKTTVARLLAQATDLHFEQISAIFTGVADLKKVFEEARHRRVRVKTGSRPEFVDAPRVRVYQKAITLCPISKQLATTEAVGCRRIEGIRMAVKLAVLVTKSG